MPHHTSVVGTAQAGGGGGIRAFFSVLIAVVAGCADPAAVPPLPATVYQPPLDDVRTTLTPIPERHWKIGVDWVDGQGAGAAWRNGGPEHTLSRTGSATFYPAPPPMWAASDILRTWHDYCASGFEPAYALILRDTQEPDDMIGDCFLYPTLPATESEAKAGSPR